MSATIRAEVAYAERERQTVRALELPQGTTVAQAVERSGIRALHDLPEDVVFGIWGRPVAPDTVLAGGERVELYRPVPVDPKETRRALAREGRTMGRGRGPLRRPGTSGRSDP